MPRPKAHSRAAIAERALPHFWAYGFRGTSVDDLVQQTGAARQAIYQAFGDKRGLFLACLDLYRDTVVTPAFGPVEHDGAGVQAVAGYFETQIARAEAGGLPGPGCLFANTMTEIAPHDPGVHAVIAAHNWRLRRGFARALSDGAPAAVDSKAISDLSAVLTVSAHGLWTMSRSTDDAAVLRAAARSLIHLIERRLMP